MWIWFTLLAAVAQAGRNAFQKQLSVNVPVLGVTLARFFYAVPLASGYLYFYTNMTITSTFPIFHRCFLYMLSGLGWLKFWQLR